jgi:tetratricopeptide (TPR) repeat protein
MLLARCYSMAPGRFFLMRLLLALVSLVCCCSTATSQTAEEMGAAATAGNWQAVETMASTRVGRVPADAVAWTFLGLAESNLGKNQQALEAFARSVRLAPGEAASHTNYGAALERAGRKREAAEEYERSLKISPKQPAALVNLARLDAEMGDVGRAKALGLLRQAWALAPDGEIAASLLVLEPCDDAGRDGYLARVNAGKVDVSLRLQAAHAMESCGQWGDAERAFRGALAGAELTAQQREDALIGVARAEIRQGRADAAETGLNAAIQAGYETPRLLAALADVEAQRGHYELAVPALLRTVTLAPDDEELRFRYGMLLLDTRTPKAAQMRTEEALKRFPDSAKLWFLLGLAHFDQDETAAAREAFDHSLALDGKFSAALAYRGMTAAGEQKYSEAEGYYRRAILAEPASAELYCLLADALEKEHPGDVGRAYAELEQAVKIDPGLSRAYLMMGRIDLDRGKPEQAIAELQKASSEDQAHFFLARAYRQTHQAKLAAEQADMYAKLSVESRTRERDEIERAVRQLGQTRF